MALGTYYGGREQPLRLQIPGIAQRALFAYHPDNNLRGVRKA